MCNSFPEQTEMNLCDMKSCFHTALFFLFQSCVHRHHRAPKVSITLHLHHLLIKDLTPLCKDYLSNWHVVKQKVIAKARAQVSLELYTQAHLPFWLKSV